MSATNSHHINNNSLQHCLRLTFRLQIDHVRISWNPISNQSFFTSIIGPHHQQQPKIDEFHLSASLFHPNESCVQQLQAISSSDIEIVDCECFGEHYSIRFNQQEIIVRCAIRYDDPQSFDVIRLDERKRIIRLSLICCDSNVLSMDQTRTIGFVDIDLAEKFCRTQSNRAKTETINMMMTTDDIGNRWINNCPMNNFCLQLSLRTKCHIQSSLHYVGLKQYNADRVYQQKAITEQVKRKLCDRLDFSQANQRKHSIFSNHSLQNSDEYSINNNDNDGNDRPSILAIVSTWLSTRNHPLGLYRIAIHFGHIEHLKAIGLADDGFVWASFRVKCRRTRNKYLIPRTKNVFCRTKSIPFGGSKMGHADLSDVGNFDQAFLFFDYFDLKENGAQTCLSLMLHSHKNIQQLVFKCPLLDYRRQPSVNQYFYLEPSNYNRKNREQTFCMLQFSIWIEAI